MKVKISLTLEIDPEAWTLNYGVSGTAEIRREAKEHAENAITEHWRDLGLLLED